MASTTSMGGAVRNTLVFGTAAFLVIMAILVIRSIFFMSSEDGTTGPAGSGGNAAGPVAVAPLDNETTDATGIRCGRPADGSDTAFRVDVAPDLAHEHVIVAVALVATDGSRHPRTVTIEAAEAGQGRQVLVADSNDPNLFVSCVVTAIQQDRKIIMTGR